MFVHWMISHSRLSRYTKNIPTNLLTSRCAAACRGWRAPDRAGLGASLETLPGPEVDVAAVGPDATLSTPAGDVVDELALLVLFFGVAMSVTF
jgi:hypothetical protein